MARNGSGAYSLPVNTWNPATNTVSATAADWQTLINDVATALTASLAADGQTPMTGNLPMGNNKLTGLAAGNAAGNSIRYEQVFGTSGLTAISATGGSDLLGFIQAGIGATARTAQGKMREQVSLRDFGAVGDGVADDGPALQLALNACKATNAKLRVDDGTYLINTACTLSGYAGLHIEGDGMNNTIFRRTASGPMLTFTGCSRGIIKGIAFDGTGMASGGCLVLDGTGVGLLQIEECQFANFPGRAIYANFLIATPASGCSFEENIFLSNGITDAVPQAEFRYCNDSIWMGNQFGTVGLGGPYPSIGNKLFTCQAGNYENNYHWNNTVGGEYTSCDYSRWVGNRWEENQREGSKFINCAFVSFVANHHHTNSQAATNTYDSMVMQSCGEWTITGDQFYNFSGILVVCRYCLNIDASCSAIVICGNSFSSYGTAPVLNSPTYGLVTFSNCYPAGFASAETGSQVLNFNSGSMVGGATAYLSPSGVSASEGPALFIPGRSVTYRRLQVILDVAPGGVQTVTVTLRKNASATAITLVITGASQSGSVTTPVSFTAVDQASIQVVKSGTAATGSVVCALVEDL